MDTQCTAKHTHKITFVVARPLSGVYACSQSFWDTPPGVYINHHVITAPSDSPLFNDSVQLGRLGTKAKYTPHYVRSSIITLGTC